MATILIVDDDKHTRKLLETVLEQDARLRRFDLRFVQAGDGEEGLLILDAEKPDVVITDLLMPRMDGFRFAEALRQREHGRAAGLIIVSGVYRELTVATRVRDEFGAAFFTKPYQIKELAVAVEKLLAARASSDEPASVTVTLGADVAVSPDVGQPMAGDFHQTPLPRLLIDLYEKRATGVLELRRGRIEKRIELVIGHPIAVSSNQRHEMLGHFLEAKNLISKALHQQALERAHDEGEKLGEALIELGALTAPELMRHLTAQARFKITGALRWPDGAWSFRPSRELFDRAQGAALDPVAVVLLGLRKTSNIEEAARLLGEHAGRQLAFTATGDRHRAAVGRIFGEPLLAALATRPVIDGLLAGGDFDTSVIFPALEALLLAGLLEPTGVATRVADRAPTADPLGLAELSEAEQALAPPAPSPPAAAPGEEAAATVDAANLYDQLFGDAFAVSEEPPEGVAVSDGVPDAPLSEADSSVVEVGALGVGPKTSRPIDAGAEAARAALIAEALRVQGKDWYGVLDLPRDADLAAIQAAFTAHLQAFALEKFAAHDLGRDYASLEDLHGIFRQAYLTLSTPEQREAYDRQLAKRGGPPTQDAMRAELSAREGERCLAAGDLDGAVEHLTRAVAAFPDVADYHAAMGWALQLRAAARPETRRADREASHAHLGQALAIDPDHAAAHEYTGRVLAEARVDDEAAVRHLEAALGALPPRLDALSALVELQTTRGEFLRLERQYRKLIFRLGDGDKDLRLRLWLALADLYRGRLEDRESARTACQCALRLSPGDPRLLAAIAELCDDDPTRFGERAEALRAHWRVEPGNAAPGLALFHAATEVGEPDVAFLAASVLAARGLGDADSESCYGRYRPRFLQRAQRTLDGELLPLARHAEDDAEIGGLFVLLEHVAEAVVPLSLGDLEVSAADRIEEAALPAAFIAVRAYVAQVLGVRVPRVARRADFGDQIHLGASAPPLLLAGPDALAATDRVALGFRLGRAMTYLWPGRAVGGSRPANVLRTLVAAAMSLGSPVAGDDPDGLGARARAVLLEEPADARRELSERLVRLAQARTGLNLSRWARALARTADRIGLLLCGDVQVAARAAAVVGGSEAIDELLDWATGPEHLALRGRMGLSIAV